MEPQFVPEGYKAENFLVSWLLTANPTPVVERWWYWSGAALPNNIIFSSQSPGITISGDAETVMIGGVQGKRRAVPGSNGYTRVTYEVRRGDIAFHLTADVKAGAIEPGVLTEDDLLKMAESIR
jgi:hypothetical protein